MKTLALNPISSRTIGHYESNAEAYFEGTRDHDVSQNINALLSAIDGEPPFTLLDFGCGPGRDLKRLTELGHTVIGLDGAARFVRMAKAYSGCEVWHQDFLALDLPASHFDGVFANASLFHVPGLALPGVLASLHQTLRSGGVLFASNPHGNNEEGWNNARYAVYHDLAHWRSYLKDAGFEELGHYYRPAGLPREEQPWLASIWRCRHTFQDE